jgi:hypothetical protein
MVSWTVVTAVRLPEVPVIVMAAGPVAADALAFSVNALDPVAGLLPKVAATPLGRPDATSVTAPVNPLAGATVIVSVPLPF